MITKKEKRGVIIYIIIISVTSLLIGTKSSPLYPLNDWVDANIFLTMGKGMANGLIPYRDLFEQKGPLLYFLHMLAYLISNKTFFGVFLLEVLAMIIFLYYTYKILRMYINHQNACLLIPLIIICTLIMPNFKHGDSAEELCLPMLTISLFYFLLYFRNSDISKKIIIINGMIAGCILWIKYTMLGFWFAWTVCIFFSYIAKKQYKKSIFLCIYFLLGMFISSVPWLIYFGLNGALIDLIKVYFIINITSYTSNLTIVGKLIKMLKVIVQNLGQNILFCLLLAVGLTSFTYGKEYIKDKWGRISIFFLLFLLMLGVYGGGNAYKYYFVIFLPFAILGLIVIGSRINISVWSKKKNICVNTFMIFITLISIYLKSPNTYFLKTKKEDLAQYLFANIINQYENPTLLNYGFLDAGFYLTANIVPNVKYFMKPNIQYERFSEIMNSQNSYLRKQKTMFVVIRVKPDTKLENIEIPYLKENYDLIASHEQYFEKRNVMYLLWQSKNTLKKEI